MKVTPLRRQSAKQAERAVKLPRFPFGPCSYCGTPCFPEVDHVIPRSLLPGPNRDHRDNLLPCCAPCNFARGAGWKPEWERLPERARRFVIAMKGERWAHRYFEFAEVRA